MDYFSSIGDFDEYSLEYQIPFEDNVEGNIIENQNNLEDVYPSSSPKASNIAPIVDENIFWWIHITDIHVEMEVQERLDNFEKFCDETISTIYPSFIVSTGDIVDGGKTGENKQVGHDIEEFIFFNETLAKYNLTEIWYNAIGNHEKYNQLNTSSYEYYIQPQPLNYDFVVNTDFGEYRFIGVDSTQHIGLKNYLNLFGEAKQDKLDIIEEVIEKRNPADFNHTILLAHHPLHQIISQKSSSGRTFKDLVYDAQTSLFFNGHVHFSSFTHHGDVLEIMGRDYKEEYGYRICVMDNDLFSYSDEILDQWPAVVISNPMDGRLLSSNFPVEKMEQLNEIRTLIFDPNPIINAYALIDGEIIGNLTQKQDNLWTVEWIPSNYLLAEHELTIVVGSSSNTTIRTIPFILRQQTPIPYRSFGGTFLSIPLYPLAVFVITILFCWSFFRIIIPRIWRLKHPSLKDKYSPYPNKRHFKKLRHSIFKLPMVKAAFLPRGISILLLIIPLYLLLGPAMIANFWLDYFGGLFLWGVFVGGHRVITLYALMVNAMYLVIAISLQSYVILRYRDSSNKLGFLSLLIALMFIGISIWLTSGYYGFITLFYNPIFYLVVGITIISFWKTELANHEKLENSIQ